MLLATLTDISRVMIPASHKVTTKVPKKVSLVDILTVILMDMAMATLMDMVRGMMTVTTVIDLI